MKTIRSVAALFLVLLFTTNTSTADQGAVGIWQSESTDEGYLHIAFDHCGNRMCGKILMAYSLEGETNDTYEHIGKNMVWGMKSTSRSSWSGGKIWDPTNNKTYKSKMSIEGDILSVSGCVLFFCKAQKWARIK